MKYLVTGMVEYYQYVEADSEEEACDNPNPHDWRQTMNMPIQNLKAQVAEIETTGTESK
jgi:hypothetical protein